jgi:ATP-dependent RNA helicase DeaD
MAAATAVPKSVKPAPVWAKPVAYVKPKVVQAAPSAEVAERTDVPAASAVPAPADPDFDESEEAPARKSKYARPARTGREPGMKTIFLNVGRKQLVTPADIVGKIAGVTRLPANVVGAMDIHQRHTLVDVAEAEAQLIVGKLGRIMLKGVSLEPAMAGPEHAKAAD